VEIFICGQETAAAAYSGGALPVTCAEVKIDQCIWKNCGVSICI